MAPKADVVRRPEVEVVERIPAVHLTTKADSGPPEMVDLFSIDDTTYQIPAKPRVNIALKYLWHAKQYGEDRAAAELLEALLGAEGFEALVNYDDLEPGDLERIMEVATKHTLGALDDIKGNSGRGSTR